MNNNIKKILVTGSADFISSSLCSVFLKRGYNLTGIDNHNNYYEIKLKDARIERLSKHNNYKHFKEDISNKKNLDKIFKDFKPQVVVNLAAQTVVNYLLKNPTAYIDSNIVDFGNILENCHYYKVDNLVYATTSSEWS